MDKIVNVNADTDILVLYKKLFVFQNELLKNDLSVTFHILRGILFEMYGANAYKFQGRFCFQINALC